MLDSNNGFPKEQFPKMFVRDELNERARHLDSMDDDSPGNFLKELLEERKRFANVFRTEKGSYYFVLSDGSSMRIQNLPESLRPPDLELWCLRPHADHIFFIEPSELSRLLDMREFPGTALMDTMAHCTVSLVGIKKGAIPFEYGFRTVRPVAPVFRVEQSTATYVGSTRDGEMMSLDSRKPEEYDFGVTHMGHPISEIIWPESYIEHESMHDLAQNIK